MAITFPLSLPSSPGFNSFNLFQLPAVSVSESPYSGDEYVLEWENQKWQADVELPVMGEADISEWRSFFGKLNGRAGTFLMGDPTRATARGSASVTPGTPLVAGASQSGNELDVDGLPLSTTGYLKKGDYFQLGTNLNARLYRLLDDVNSNGSGEATFLFWPKLRIIPGDNDAVIVSAAKGLFRLTENMTGDSAEPKPLYRTRFSARSV